tara:strand:- start:29806 stop:29988 length:183 start_codon:yes stop_codon:yes gene_type:complete
MIVTLILRAIFIYFLWSLIRRLWSNYSQAKAKSNPSESKSKPAAQGDVFEADFRVLNDND